MELTLSVTRYQDLPPERATRITMGEQGGSIGRHADNDLVLPDPERWVSAQHASIVFRAGHFYLTDVSTNGTFINHSPQRVTPGQAVQLHDGDELSIGAYEVEVAVVQHLGAPEPDASFDPFAEQKPSLEALAETRERATPDVLDLVGATPREPGPHIPPPPATGQANGGPPGPAGQWPHAEPLEQAFGAGGKTPPARPPSRLGGSEADDTPAEQAFFHTPAAIPEDYDLLADATQGERAPERPPAGDAEAAFEAILPGGAVPSKRPPDPPAEQPPQAVEHASPGQPPLASETELLAAFLEGLGRADTRLPPETAAQFMRSAGELLRALTEGLMQVLMARASFKSELRIEMTTIRPVENNPFKFSVGVEDALTNLLFRDAKGFLPPLEAAQGAYDDIRAHELAIIAGLRSALRAQLQRFDPEELERQFSGQSVLDNLLPIARKAKYWDLFTEVYAEVARDASEGFMRLFGEAFTRAYEEQVARLERGRERPLN